MGGIAKDELFAADGLRSAREQINDRFREAGERGSIEHPLASLGIYDFPRPGVLHFNATRVFGLPALRSAERTRVEIEGRRQAVLLADWLRRECPAFQHAFLESVATHIGVRETRRLIGRYTMSGADIVSGARFDDGIARSGYFIDIHSPSAKEKDAPPDKSGMTTGAGGMPRHYYEIPLRCLQTTALANLLVACRAISTDHYAHAATRVMATLTAVGEAAGRAVAMARRMNTEPGSVNGSLVRREIRYLDEPLSF